MKQVIHDRFGPPSVVSKCVELKDLPAPSAWEVTVAVDAFPINPADLAMIQGRYGILNKPPCMVGMEGVGTVTHVGRSVNSLEVGDRVVLLANNNWCSHRNVPATLVVKVPTSLDPIQLCMLKVSGLTALHLLTRVSQQKPGSYIVQNAPLSAVGRYLIQLAKAYELKTVNLVRRSEQIEQVKKLGGMSRSSIKKTRQKRFGNCSVNRMLNWRSTRLLDLRQIDWQIVFKRVGVSSTTVCSRCNHATWILTT